MKKFLFRALLCTMFVFYLTGCSTVKSSSSSPRETVIAFLDTLQKGKYSATETYYSENMDNMSHFKNKLEGISPLLANKFFERIADFDYTIQDVSIDPNTPDKATALVAFTCYDLGKPLEKLLLDYIKTDFEMTFDGAKSEDIITKAEETVVKEIENSKKNYSEMVPITLIKQDGNWQIDKISSNPALLNVLSGNIINTINTLSNLLNQ